MITLDFETYYSKTYSLSKMTTEEYVNGDEFEVIGVGIKVDDKPTIFYTGEKRLLKIVLDHYDIPNQILLCHNTFFDATILSEYFGITAKRYLDTLSMARAIHGISVGGSLAKLVEHYGIGVKGTEVVNALGKHLKDFTEEELARYGEYCVNDVEVTYKLFHALMPHFNTQELSLIDITIKMATKPTLTIDLPMLESYLHEVRTKKEDLLSRVVADKKELMSNPKFAALLEQYGVEPPMKVSPTTGKLTYAFAKTDDGLKDLLEHENPDVQALVATRLGVKSTIEETRTERFIGIAKRTNYLPIPLNYYGAATGRWSAGSGQKLNLQNLPRESTLKKAIVAPDGMVVVGADLSNIELRVGLWVCDEMEALKSLGDGRDLYKEFASLAFNVPYEEVTKAQRFIGKTSQLGLIFGVGAAKLRDAVKSGSGTDLGEMEAKRIVDLYRKTYTGVTAFWKTCSKAIKAIADDDEFTFGREGLYVVDGKRGVKLPSGLYMQYPQLENVKDIESGEEGYKYKLRNGYDRLYGGKLTNNCIAEGTLVLTDSGWKPIEEVQLDDKVHDGDKFVTHGGIVYKSVQECVIVDGVYMTPDHEVLTDEGWKAALEKPRPYRPDIRGISRTKNIAQRWEKNVLGVSMLKLWDRSSKSRGRCNPRSEERGNSQLWMPFKDVNFFKEHEARYDFSPCMGSMGGYESSMFQPKPQSVEELRWSRYSGVSRMARIIPNILCRYGEFISRGVIFGKSKQRRGVSPSKLPLGYEPRTKYESESIIKRGKYSRTIKNIWDKSVNAILQSKSWSSYRTTDSTSMLRKHVYDIINAGDQQRFVVSGTEAPFIVHNCVQATARCIMSEAMVRIAKRYQIALSIHDALYIVVPEAEAQEALDFLIGEMCKPPLWMPDIPLAAEGGWGRSIADC
jgi:DNA polymerase